MLPQGRLIGFYLRSHSFRISVLALLGAGTLSWLWMGSQRNEVWAAWLAIVAPIMAAVALGVGLESPFTELEETIATPLALLRGGHRLLVLVGGVATLALPQSFTARQVPWFLLTTLAGDIGLLLLGQALAGSGWGWGAPVIYGSAVYLTLLQNPQVRGPSELPLWMWPLHRSMDTSAVLMPSALLLIGWGVSALRVWRK